MMRDSSQQAETTVHQIVTTTRVKLANVTQDQTYSMQNLAQHEVFIQVAENAPSDEDGASVLFPRGHILSVGDFKAGKDESVWIWSPWADGSASRLIYRPAP